MCADCPFYLEETMEMHNSERCNRFEKYSRALICPPANIKNRLYISTDVTWLCTNTWNVSGDINKTPISLQRAHLPWSEVTYSFSLRSFE